MDVSPRFGERLRIARQSHPQKPSVATLQKWIQRTGRNIPATRINRFELGYADPTPAERDLLLQLLNPPAAPPPESSPTIAVFESSTQVASLPEGVSPEVAALAVPVRKSTDDVYTYRGLLIQELARVRDWAKKPPARAGDAAAFLEHRARLEEAIAQTRRPAVAAPPLTEAVG